MSGQSARRQATTANASAWVPAIVALPPELLETILGFLDVGTLCTARLVCAHFRGAASSCLHSVELSVETVRSRPETTLEIFPNLSRVSVFDVKKDDLRMLAQSPVAAAVTHLQAVGYLRPVPRHTRTAPGLRLMPLPNLTSLTVRRSCGSATSFPQTLRELSLEAPVDFRTANLVAGLTNLTSLRIGTYNLCDKLYGAVTALTALERLEIRNKLSLIPVLAALTLLTHLQFHVEDHELLQGLPSDLAHLASLRRLVHLGVTHIGVDLGRQLLSTVATTFTGLKSLDLGMFGHPEQAAFETVCMTPFSQLTALSFGHHGYTGTLLPRFNWERLQDLSIKQWVDGDVVAALRRATGLTHLSLRQFSWDLKPDELGTVLSRMSRLRALCLGDPDMSFDIPPPVSRVLKAIAPLTELTRLEVIGPGITNNAGVDVCLGLKKLRVLHLIAPPWQEHPFYAQTPADPAIPKILSAIAKLPELRKFVVLQKELREDVRAWLNAERHAKGWPSWELGESRIWNRIPI